MTWIGVNTFQKFQLRQLRQRVFFGAIWPLHLGTLRKLHTKHWFALSSSMQHLFGIPIMNLRLARWTCRRWRNTSSVGDMLDELEWPSLETRREQSSLTFFYKIHSDTVSLDKDKYHIHPFKRPTPISAPTTFSEQNLLISAPAASQHKMFIYFFSFHMPIIIRNPLPLLIHNCCSCLKLTLQ